MKTRTRTITIIAETNSSPKALKLISDLSDYIPKVLEGADILTNLQSFPKGYRLTYTVSYIEKGIFKHKNYTCRLAKLSEWLNGENADCLYQYHYNVV